jgi:signal peptidase
MRRVVRAIGLVAGALLLLGWLAFLRPSGFGGPATYLLVSGSSMLPTLHDGDLAILLPDATYRAGEIVAYRVPAGEPGAGRLVIHRITGGDASGGYELLGDNNPAPDPFHPTAADVVGRPRLLLPGLGWVMLRLRDPAILGALLAAIAVVAVLSRPSAAQRTTQPTG